MLGNTYRLNSEYLHKIQATGSSPQHFSNFLFNSIRKMETHTHVCVHVLRSKIWMKFCPGLQMAALFFKSYILCLWSTYSDLIDIIRSKQRGSLLMNTGTPGRSGLQELSTSSSSIVFYRIIRLLSDLVRTVLQLPQWFLRRRPLSKVICLVYKTLLMLFLCRTSPEDIDTTVSDMFLVVCFYVQTCPQLAAKFFLRSLTYKVDVHCTASRLECFDNLRS